MSMKMMTYIPTGVVVPFDEAKLSTGLYEAWPPAKPAPAEVEPSFDPELPEGAPKRKQRKAKPEQE